MKHLEKIRQLCLSIALAGLLLMLLTTSLWAASTYSLTRVTTASPSGRGSHRPSINSDGSKIAFDSDADFLGQGILDDQDEIWLYDTATMTVTRVTTAAGIGDRDSRGPSINSDGSKIAFYSDADFLGQGIPQYQFEIWLAGPPDLQGIGGHTEPMSLLALLWPWGLLAAVVGTGGVAALVLKRRVA